MATNKPRPSQAGQLHRIAALGYHVGGYPVNSARGIRKVKDSQGNSISAPKRRNWNSAANDVLINITSSKGKERAVQVDNETVLDDDGPQAGPSTPQRNNREREGVSTRLTRSPSKKKKRQFMDCVLLPSRSKPPLIPGPQQSSTETPPLPDSEFLKLIHYSASTFYESRGQLRDRSELLSEVLHAGDDLREAKREHAKGKAPKPSRQRSQNAEKMKTMHTALGGDVLVALGILLEEDIIHQLKPTELPEGWDEMKIVDDEAYPLEGDDEDEGVEHEAEATFVGNDGAGPSEQNTETVRQTRSRARQTRSTIAK
ncbi:hypothetical protein FRC04_000080 [Tulasnella sp. 424]|nr:hypothetical protein FRC04_000080 [Tulasnella sp. 424]KAG8981942.1 hypothetical protein FRC05_000084 [Tulasnella sp. 425]